MNSSNRTPLQDQPVAAGHHLHQLHPVLHRVTCANPSMFTGPGTNTYIVGDQTRMIVDPGPLREDHLSSLQEFVSSICDPADVGWIAVTHTHGDHSPGVQGLRRLFPNAITYGAPHLGQDATFMPQRIAQHGDVIDLGSARVQAIHTPGHASNHFCFYEETTQTLLTGDHIMQGSTVVINPPDGNMTEYIEALRRLKALDVAALAPAHGQLITQPMAAIDALIAHRLKRENKVLRALEDVHETGATLEDLVARVYDDVGRERHGIAKRSLLAHLLRLRTFGSAEIRGDVWHHIPGASAPTFLSATPA